MAYTRLQWDKIQSTMPQEDRVSYLEYIKIADPAEYAVLTAPKTTTLSRLKADAQTDSAARVSISAVESAAQKRALEREQKAREQAEIDYATKILPGGLKHKHK
jgi:hypothetical protein